MLTRLFFALLSSIPWIAATVAGQILAESAKITNDVKVLPRLPILALEASKHQLELLEAADQWQPDGGAALKGKWNAFNIRLDDLPLKTEEIAAIFSSSNSTRTRIFMRNGKVLLGKLNWQDGHFLSETIGLVKINPDRPGKLILRSKKTDTPDPKIAAWMMDKPNGRIIPITSLSKTSRLTYHTMWGTFALAWEEIESIRSKRTGSSAHQVYLKNGSHLIGWAHWKDSGLPVDTCYAWAQQQAQLAALLTDTAEPKKPIDHYLQLSDGSLIQGNPEELTLSWLMEASEIQLPINKCMRVKQLVNSVHKKESPSPTFVLTTDQQTWTVKPMRETLAWLCEKQKLIIPWVDIESIDIRTPPIPKSPSTP